MLAVMPKGANSNAAAIVDFGTLIWPTSEL
jgi:hypothetical protein